MWKCVNLMWEWERESGKLLRNSICNSLVVIRHFIFLFFHSHSSTFATLIRLSHERFLHRTLLYIFSPGQVIQSLF